MHKNQKGFAVVEGLLILAIIALIAGTGWYVWNSKNQTDKTLESAGNRTLTKDSKTSSTAKDPTEDWVSYSSKDGKFSLKYPTSWVTASHPELCSDNVLLLGPSSTSVGVCASESFGEVSINDSTHGCFTLDENDFKGVETTPVSVDGIQGKRYSGVSKDSGAFVGLPANSKVVQYCFSKAGLNYSAEYNQPPDYPNVLNDFDLIVTKTLKFSN